MTNEIILQTFYSGSLIGMVGGGDSSQKTKLVFCIGQFGSILIIQQLPYVLYRLVLLTKCW